MRKLFPFLVAGLAAASFSVFAADTSTDTKADTNADVKADTGTAGAGASTDVKTDSKKTRKVRKAHKDKNAASGSSTRKDEAVTEKHDKRGDEPAGAASGSTTTAPAAPAPAPTAPAPIDTPKKTD